MNETGVAVADQPGSSRSALPRAAHGRLADLAFGSVETRSSGALTTDGLDPGRHLAFLPSALLELDLSDPDERAFGDYELLELIGEGGMGVVYRARQTSLDREVAVKLLSAGPWASRDFIERFQREAQNAARMQHPNIVPIHEVGAVEGLHFFSMRLIRGTSLSHVIQAGPRPTPQRAAALLRTIAEAVDYAHRLNVLHLDLKPGNVLLDENGEPHVADFGLARRLEQGLAADNTEISGTPSYMAPEQARAQQVTVATDVWGLGAILYELVTGEPPYRAPSAQDTLKLVVGATVRSPRRFSANLPRDLEAVILKCLRKDPADRYSSARALAEDLSRFIEGRPVRARPLNLLQRLGRWARREPKTAGLALVALIALSGGLIATTQQWRRAQASATQAAASATLASERLWQSRIDQADTALREGRSYDALPLLAANIAEREAQGVDPREDRIRIGLAERSAPRLIDTITLGERITGVAASPDGASVAVATIDEKMRLFDSATGVQRWEASFGGATRFVPGIYHRPIELAILKFSPDGRWLVARDHFLHEEAPAPTGWDEVLFDATDGKILTPPSELMPDFRDATYSADGAFAFVYTQQQRVVLMRTADWRMLATPRAFVSLARVRLLANGGHYLATSAEDDDYCVIEIYDARSLALLHRVSWPKSQRVTTWAASPDGESLGVGHLDGGTELISFASGHSRALQPHPAGRIGWVTFSADGRWFGAASHYGDIQVWDGTSGDPVAPPLRLNVPPSTTRREQMVIDAGARTVLASSDKEMALWYLPNAVTPPLRISSEFPNLGADWFRVFGYDAAHGLIATDGGGDGELHLWRAPLLASTGRRAAPLQPAQLRVDDGRIVAVERNRVTVAAAADGHAPGPVLELPQMPTFAELGADGKSVIATVGPTLGVWDAATLQPLRAPIALPNDPARVMLSPDSRHALLLFADHGDGHDRELAQDWDLETGAPTSAPLPVEHDDILRFRADGKALVWSSGARVRVVDATTLQPLSEWFDATKQAVASEPGLKLAENDEALIVESMFSRDGSQIDVLSVNGPMRASVLWHIDATTAREISHVLLGATHGNTFGAETFVAMPDRRAFVVQWPDFGPVWWDASQGARRLPGLGPNEFSALALAPDAALFARAAADAVVLTSTRSLRTLAAPLPTAAARVSDNRTEHPIQLAFTGNGNTIVGRSRRGRWLSWNVTPDLRPAEQLVREANWLNPSETTEGSSGRAPLSAEERSMLRAADPGAPPFATAADGDGPAPRRADTPDRLIDLSTSYTRAPDEAFAPGWHRFLGVDYDARGTVALDPAGAGVIDASRRVGNVTAVRRVEGIRPALSHVRALDALVSFPKSIAAGTEGPRAVVEIAYRDGSRAGLPIAVTPYMNAFTHGELYPRGIDVDSNSSGIAWQTVLDGTPRVYRRPDRRAIFAVRLDNPYPEREVASIALEATGKDGMPVLFFALTIEPVVTPGRTEAAQ